jgi:putative transposase
MVLKAFKFRLYPTDDQERAFARTFGAVRYIYNWGLDLTKAKWDHIEVMRYSWGGDFRTCDMEMVATMKNWELKDKSKDGYPTPLNHKQRSAMLTHELKKEEPWLNEVADKPLRYALRNLDQAYQNFFRRCKTNDKNPKKPKKDEAPGFPSFKSRKSNQSFQVQGENVRLDEDAGFVSLPKIEKISIRLHRRVTGTIKTTTVSRTKSGKYYISFQVDDGLELPPLKPVRSATAIGIDVGLSTFVTTSDGEKINGITPFRNSMTRLAVLQKRASRKEVRSQNWKKAQRKVAIVYEKIANQRRDFQHKLSRRLVDDHSAIFVEDLNIAGMIKNHTLAKSISDAAWYQFIQQLSYKASWAGKTFAKIDRWEPSSKTCSSCGYKVKDMPLSTREWNCPSCGSLHDRDINAAINIKNAGLNLLHTNAI